MEVVETASPIQERVPVAHRLGPLNPTGGAGRGKKKVTAKRKPGRPPGKKQSPKALMGITSKKRNLLATQPTSYRMLNMENQEEGEPSRRPRVQTSGSASHSQVDGEDQRGNQPTLG